MHWSGRSRIRRFTYLVAEADAELVGVVFGYREPDHANDHYLSGLDELEGIASGTWFIGGLAGSAKGRSYGVEPLLLEAASDEATRTAARGLSTIVSLDLPSARPLGRMQAFYETQGFTVCGERDGLYSLGDPVRWLLMIRERRPH